MKRFKIKVRELCRQKYNKAENLYLYSFFTPIDNAIFVEFHKAVVEKNLKTLSEMVNDNTDAKEELHSLLTTSNVRFLKTEGRFMKKLANVVHDQEHYAVTSSTISAFAEPILAQHPKTGNWVDPDTLRADELLDVTFLDVDISIFDGQHRAYTFGEVVQKFKKDIEAGFLPESPVRETRMTLFTGFEPPKHHDLRIFIAAGHNTNQNVPDSTVENKLGHFDLLKKAGGKYSDSVEWVQNGRKNERKQIYKPFEWLKIMDSVKAVDYSENSVVRADTKFYANLDQYEPLFHLFPVLLEAFEIIKYESDKLTLLTKTNSPSVHVSSMFVPSRVYLTATLGEVRTAALTNTFALAILNSFRSQFTWTYDSKTKNLVSVTLNTTKEEFLQFVRFALTETILEAISKRPPAAKKDREFCRMKRPGNAGENTKGKGITYLGAFICNKANKQAQVKWLEKNSNNNDGHST